MYARIKDNNNKQSKECVLFFLLCMILLYPTGDDRAAEEIIYVCGTHYYAEVEFTFMHAW